MGHKTDYNIHWPIPLAKAHDGAKEYSRSSSWNEKGVQEILEVQDNRTVNITLKKKCLRQYFPKEYTQRQMEEVILSLLETWKFQQKGAEPNDHDG